MITALSLNFVTYIEHKGERYPFWAIRGCEFIWHPENDTLQYDRKTYTRTSVIGLLGSADFQEEMTWKDIQEESDRYDFLL